MQIRHLLFLIALTTFFITNSFAQHKRVKIKNGIAIIGGITQFDISTDNFMTEKGDGFVGGLTATVDLPHKWYTVSYGMQFAENKLSIQGRPTAGTAVNFADESLESGGLVRSRYPDRGWGTGFQIAPGRRAGPCS